MASMSALSANGPPDLQEPGGPSGNANPLNPFNTNVVAITAQMMKELKQRNLRRAERRGKPIILKKFQKMRTRKSWLHV